MIDAFSKYFVSLKDYPLEKHSPLLLICPFAGASYSSFSSWNFADLCGLECKLFNYSGHGNRFKEAVFNNIVTIADELVKVITTTYSKSDQPLLLCGHSMGAQVAFETAIKLEKVGWPLGGLILSGCQAPHLRSRRLLSHLNDEEFIQQLIQIGGCSVEITKHPDILKQFIPLLRADFLATESYFFEHPIQRLFHTPVLLIYGNQDEEAYPEEVKAWKNWINGICIPKNIVGDHFYPSHRPNSFCRTIIDFYHRFCQ